MATDLKTFLEIYGKPSNGVRIDRNGYEFRYCTAALLIACSRADEDEDPEEERVILDILQKRFSVSETTLQSVLNMARTMADDDLDAIARLINSYYHESDKQQLLKHLWMVAFADGRIDDGEEAFIRQVARLIKLTEDDVEAARGIATPA